MPRRARAGTAGLLFHVLNRAARHAALFQSDREFDAFELLIAEAKKRIDVPFFSYILMPTHFHFVVWPKNEGDLSTFMHWLTVTHTQRWHARNRTAGTGSLFQGRFKAFPVQTDVHFLRVCRYVERNALRAGLCERAQDWRWSSLGRHCRNCTIVPLDPWPVPRPADWVAQVNSPQTASELTAIRRAVQRGTPYGDASWTVRLTNAKRTAVS